jgi:hypothetical protein
MMPAALGTIVSQRLVAANRQARACNAPDDQSMSDRRFFYVRLRAFRHLAGSGST